MFLKRVHQNDQKNRMIHTGNIYFWDDDNQKFWSDKTDPQTSAEFVSTCASDNRKLKNLRALVNKILFILSLSEDEFCKLS